MLLTTRPILRRFGMYLCRECINREYGVHLKREDVRYKYTEDPCPYCGATNHVVTSFTVTGLYKLRHVWENRDY